MEMGETLSCLHSEGLIIGCLDVNSFVFDDVIVFMLISIR